eukprot:15542757-Heterocapsa_arctica.AAC.1
MNADDNVSSAPLPGDPEAPAATPADPHAADPGDFAVNAGLVRRAHQLRVSLHEDPPIDLAAPQAERAEPPAKRHRGPHAGPLAVLPGPAAPRHREHHADRPP